MSTNRGVGLSAFTNRSSLTSSYASHGAALRSSQGQSLKAQLSSFQQALHHFALQHGEKIKKDPNFRAEFARMCNAIGVDPLAGSNAAAPKGKSKGWLGSALGGEVGEFWYRVAVRVVDVCRASRDENGGLLALDQCREVVQKGKGIGGGMEVSNDDIIRAVESLKPLGSGFSIVSIAGKQMIRSIPKELNTDQATVLEALHVLGFVTVSMLEDNLAWEHARAVTVIQDLETDSLVWVDLKCGEAEYWSPAFLAGADE